MMIARTPTLNQRWRRFKSAQKFKAIGLGEVLYFPTLKERRG
jgi:hypothetical protein